MQIWKAKTCGLSTGIGLEGHSLGTQYRHRYGWSQHRDSVQTHIWRQNVGVSGLKGLRPASIGRPHHGAQVGARSQQKGLKGHPPPWATIEPRKTTPVDMNKDLTTNVPEVSLLNKTLMIC